MAKHLFKKGDAKPPNSGRKKGTKNKVTSDIKEMVLSALNNPRIGGEERFIAWIDSNARTREVFYSWLMKMLPSNVDIDHSGQIDHAVFVMPRPKKESKEKKEDAS